MAPNLRFIFLGEKKNGIKPYENGKKKMMRE
jgi:hypothetical protein